MHAFYINCKIVAFPFTNRNIIEKGKNISFWCGVKLSMTKSTTKINERRPFRFRSTYIATRRNRAQFILSFGFAHDLESFRYASPIHHIFIMVFRSVEDKKKKNMSLCTLIVFRRVPLSWIVSYHAELWALFWCRLSGDDQTERRVRVDQSTNAPEAITCADNCDSTVTIL